MKSIRELLKIRNINKEPTFTTVRGDSVIYLPLDDKIIASIMIEELEVLVNEKYR